MPYTEKQRRAVFAELNRRHGGAKPKLFKGMSNQELQEYAHAPLEKKKKKKK